MKTSTAERRTQREIKTENKMSRFAKIFLLLVILSASYLVVSFQPLNKEEHKDKINKMNEGVEPFRKNISECAHQVRASSSDVEHFLKGLPQSTMQGKCFVACILKRNALIVNNKFVPDNLIKSNEAVYGNNAEVMTRLRKAIDQCAKVVQDIFEICEYASIFNDCMHMEMEHLLDKVTMERRMEAMGQMSSGDDNWMEDDDEMMQMMKDEL